MAEARTVTKTSNGPRMPVIDVASLNDTELDVIIENARRFSTPKPAWYQTLASNRSVAKVFASYWDTVFRRGRVEHQIKELMRVCIAQLLGCDFCAAQRSVVAAEQGLSETVIQACATPDFDYPDPRTRAALRLARELALDTPSSDLSRFDSIYADLRKVFDDEEVMELAGICILFVGGTRLARSLNIDQS